MVQKRIEGNIENGNCYFIRIDYVDDNKEAEKEEEMEEEGEEEEKVKVIRRQLFKMAPILLGYNEI